MATFILVHGTFPGKASWPALEAALIKTAAEVNEPANFVRILWSGRNRATARQTAGEAILASVRQIRSENNESIFIIGHSHGGSAIAYFLKRYHTDDLVGCAFLSTPFIAIRTRNNFEEVANLVRIFLVSAVVVSMLMFALAFALGEPYGFEHNVWLSPLSWAGMGVAALSLLLIVDRKLMGPAPIERLPRTLREQTAELPDGNYLFLRCSGDEAAAALSSAQFILWVSFKAYTLLERLLSRLITRNQILQIFLACFIVPLVGLVAILAFLAGFPSSISWAIQEFSLTNMVFVAFEIVVLTLGYVLYVGGALTLAILFAQALVARAFGWTDLATGFFVELAIEPLPFGRHALEHIDWHHDDGTLDGMVHSWTYSHPRAIARLQNWVRDRLRLVRHIAHND